MRPTLPFVCSTVAAVCLSSLLAPTPARADDAGKPQTTAKESSPTIETGWQVAFRIGGASPLGELGSVSPHGAYVGFEVAYAPASWPVSLGVIAEAAFPGSDDSITGGRAVQNHRLGFGGALVRYSPLRGRVRPYVDATVGVRQVATNTEMLYQAPSTGIFDFDRPWVLAKEERSTRDFLGYGASAGVRLSVSTRETSSGKRAPGVAFIDFRVSYMRGGDVDYVVADSAIIDTGSATHMTKTASADALMFTLGLALSQ